MSSRIFLLFCCCSLIVLIGSAAAKDHSLYLQSRVVASTETHISKYPHAVSVRRKLCSICAYEHYCGGSIIKSNVILTAASCVREAELIYTQVIVGTSYSTGAARDGHIFTVKAISIHDDATADVAILHLDADIAIDNLTTKVIGIAKQLPQSGQKAIVTGWGQVTEYMAGNENLREVVVPLMDHEECKQLYSWHTVSDNEICAGYRIGGADACHGDGGSALLFNHEIIGIVSWGNGCARPNNPGVYTNAVNLRDWIESHL